MPFVDYSPQQLPHDDEMDVPLIDLQDGNNTDEMTTNNETKNNENNKERKNNSIVVATAKEEVENIVKIALEQIVAEALEHMLPQP